MSQLGVSVKMSGPVFDGRAIVLAERIGSETIRQLVEMGNDRLNQLLSPRPQGVYLAVPPGRSTGYYRQHLHHQVEGLHGIIGDGGVVYGPWLEGTSSRNSSSRFKGYSSFRQTQDWLEKQAGDVLNKWAAKLVAEMNA